MKKISLSKGFSETGIDTTSNIVAMANGRPVKVANRTAMNSWKRNDKEDEVFISFAGLQKIQLRDGSIELNEGELVGIPRGVEYRSIPYGRVGLVTI